MAIIFAPHELALRSDDATWDRTKWEQLRSDGNRYEVIAGVLYMTTAPSPVHQWVLQQLHLLLHARLQATGWGFIFFAPIGVFMPGCDPVQPDVIAIRIQDAHIIQPKGIEGVPALIVEVQSSGNPGYDNRTKRAAYARAGVPEYWIVRPLTRDVLICSQPDPAQGDFGRSEIIGGDATLVAHTLPVQFTVASLFAGIPPTALS